MKPFLMVANFVYDRRNDANER